LKTRGREDHEKLQWTTLKTKEELLRGEKINPDPRKSTREVRPTVCGGHQPRTEVQHNGNLLQRNPHKKKHRGKRKTESGLRTQHKTRKSLEGALGTRTSTKNFKTLWEGEPFQNPSVGEKNENYEDR